MTEKGPSHQLPAAPPKQKKGRGLDPFRRLRDFCVSLGISPKSQARTRGVDLPMQARDGDSPAEAEDELSETRRLTLGQLRERTGVDLQEADTEPEEPEGVGEATRWAMPPVPPAPQAPEVTEPEEVGEATRVMRTVVPSASQVPEVTEPEAGDETRWAMPPVSSAPSVDEPEGVGEATKVVRMPISSAPEDREVAEPELEGGAETRVMRRNDQAGIFFVQLLGAIHEELIPKLNFPQEVPGKNGRYRFNLEIRANYLELSAEPFLLVITPAFVQKPANGEGEEQIVELAELQKPIPASSLVPGNRKDSLEILESDIPRLASDLITEFLENRQI